MFTDATADTPNFVTSFSAGKCPHEIGPEAFLCNTGMASSHQKRKVRNNISGMRIIWLTDTEWLEFMQENAKEITKHNLRNSKSENTSCSMKTRLKTDIDDYYRCDEKNSFLEYALV